MKSVATNEAKTHLSSLIAEANRGETIVIMRGRKPIAKLVPYREADQPRPKVGQTMDTPLHVPDEALRPMDRNELKIWGIG